MASMFLRLVHGNVANPSVDDGIPVDLFIGALNAWRRGEISRLDIENGFGLDAGDIADLQQIKDWYDAMPTAGDREHFLLVLRDRLTMGQWKKLSDANGFLGYAVKSTFLNGFDGTHPLSGLRA